jgi:hypothetical protein
MMLGGVKTQKDSLQKTVVILMSWILLELKSSNSREEIDCFIARWTLIVVSKLNAVISSLVYTLIFPSLPRRKTKKEGGIHSA